MDLQKSAFSNETALLIVDMVSDFTFEDGRKLFDRSLGFIEELSSVRTWAKSQGVPIIYVNDELGKGRDGLAEDLEGLEKRSEEAAQILAKLRPEPDDHWIVKPQRSGFYATPLGNLLMSLNTESVIVTGVTTDICVLFTAHDAYMRGYSVCVPRDCCTAVEDAHHEEALRFMERVAAADTSSFKNARCSTPKQRPITLTNSPMVMSGGRATVPSRLAFG